jgi:PAS domain S-box-containing protein
MLQDSRFWRFLLLTGAIAALCYGTAWATFGLTRLGLEPSAIWPPAGIALAAMLTWGYRTGVGIGLGLFAFSVALIQQTMGQTTGLQVAAIAAGATVGAVAEAIAATWLLRRWGTLLHQRSAGPAALTAQPSPLWLFQSVRGVVTFVALAVLVAPTVNATLNTLNGVIAGISRWDQFLDRWYTFWLGDGISILLFTPLLLLMMSALRVQVWPLRRAQLTRLIGVQNLLHRMANAGREQSEKGLWLLLTLVTSGLAFLSSDSTLGPGHYPFEILPFALIGWAALRFGVSGALVGSALVSVFALVGSMHGHGPFFAKTLGNVRQAILLLQFYMGFVITSALLLATAVLERDHAQKALVANENRFRAIMENLAIGMAITDLHGHMIDVNPAFEAMLGYSRAELLQMVFTDYTHPDDIATDWLQFQDMLQGQHSSYQLEKRYIHRSGEIFWVRLTVSLVRDAVGQPLFSTAVVEDIHDRKRATEQARINADANRLLAEFAARIHRSLNREELFRITVEEVRRVFQADRVYVCAIAKDGRGRTVAESVDSQWRSTMDLVTQPSDFEILRALFSQQRIRLVTDTAKEPPLGWLSQYYKLYQIRASLTIALVVDGEQMGLLTVNQCTAPRQWQDHEVDLLAQLATQVEVALKQEQLYDQVKELALDLEQQVAARTAELQQRMDELEQVNQQRELLLHAVSHDLRTPVQGMLMVLKRLSQSEDEVLSLPKSMVTVMAQSCENQLNLLNSLGETSQADEAMADLGDRPLRDLSSIAGTRDVDTPKTVERAEFVGLEMGLDAVVQSALKGISPLMVHNQTQITLQIPADLPPVGITAQSLQQVYHQLLMNAVQHNPPGTTLTLGAEVVVEGDLAQVRCTVQDNGRGLTPAQRDRAFKLYVRGIDNRRLTGIGLGLYQCHQMITASGGKIGIHSQPGAGTEVWFTVPVPDLWNRVPSKVH